MSPSKHARFEILRQTPGHLDNRTRGSTCRNKIHTFEGNTAANTIMERHLPSPLINVENVPRQPPLPRLYCFPSLRNPRAAVWSESGFSPKRRAGITAFPCYMHAIVTCCTAAGHDHPPRSKASPARHPNSASKVITLSQPASTKHFPFTIGSFSSPCVLVGS